MPRRRWRRGHVGVAVVMVALLTALPSSAHDSVSGRETQATAHRQDVHPGLSPHGTDEALDMINGFVAEFTLDHETAFIPDSVAAGSIPGAVTRPDGVYVHVTDRFRWAFTSFNDWTWSRVCCVDPIDGSDPRDQIQARPDGTRWYRDSPDEEWIPAGEFDPAEGFVPLPDLAPRTTGTPTDVSADAEAVMAGFGYRSSDVTAISLDGGTTRVCVNDLNLTIEYTEFADDGYLIRRLLLDDVTG